MILVGASEWRICAVEENTQHRVENNASWRRTGCQSHRQLRVVANDSVDAHEHSVGCRSHRVRDASLLLAADPPGVAIDCGDATVDALGVLDHDIWPIRLGSNVAEQRAGVDGGRQLLRRDVVDQCASWSHVTQSGLLGAQVASVARVCSGRQRSDRRDLDTGMPERLNLPRVVRQQLDRAHTKDSEDVRRVGIVSGVHRKAEAHVGLHRVGTVVLLDVASAAC